MRRILLVVLVLLALAGQAWAAPSIVQTSSAKKIATGEQITYLFTYALPSSDTLAITEAQLKYTIPLELTFVSATGPKLIISGPAQMTWTNVDGSQGLALSNSCATRAIGQTQTYSPVAGVLTIGGGDLAPGDGDVATIVLKR